VDRCDCRCNVDVVLAAAAAVTEAAAAVAEAAAAIGEAAPITSVVLGVATP
jgi:hypothetical protein